MVILNVFNSLDFGGIESRAYMIHSSSVGHAFVAISKGGAVQERIAKEGGKVFVLNVDSKIPSFSAVRSLYHLFKTVKPDVVHCRGAEANFHGLLAAWAAGVPVRIVEEIGIPTHGRLGKALFRLVYMFSHRVVAISDAVQNWLVDNREVLRSKTVRIYNPVQVERHDNKNRVAPCDSVFRICFVGRLEEVKNPTSLIRAVSLLRNENIPVELVIVGDGSQREVSPYALSWVWVML
jgi:glycosyltransferase involved in cell wall biosynthesis